VDPCNPDPRILDPCRLEPWMLVADELPIPCIPMVGMTAPED